MGDKRRTIDAAPLNLRTALEPTRPPETYYSMKRTDERSSLVERGGSGSVVVPGPRFREPKWRAEIAGDRVYLRADGIEIELPIEDARRIAEMILHR